MLWTLDSAFCTCIVCVDRVFYSVQGIQSRRASPAVWILALLLLILLVNCTNVTTCNYSHAILCISRQISNQYPTLYKVSIILTSAAYSHSYSCTMSRDHEYDRPNFLFYYSCTEYKQSQIKLHPGTENSIYIKLLYSTY